MTEQLVVGIDATNIRHGGGVTHLIELLRAAVPEKHAISKVVVWGGEKTLSALESRPWLERIELAHLGKGLMTRILWQRFKLSRAAQASGCDVLFIPGGSFAGSFRPFVTMSQNLLPFEWLELRRYGWSLAALKQMALRWTQSHTFRLAEGVIFLSDYARNSVLRVTGRLDAVTAIIPHGLAARFQMKPKAQRSIREYSDANPYRLLYVSTVDHYKHQWRGVEAVAALRDEGLPLALDLVGPAHPSVLVRLNQTLVRLDATGRWARYLGALPYSELHEHYSLADLGIWASSCETFGISLVEKMAAGLPIACSSRGPMPEILGDAGVFFDPERPVDLVRALRELIESPELRAVKASASYRAAQGYSWDRCAEDTFGFLARMAMKHRGLECVT